MQSESPGSCMDTLTHERLAELEAYVRCRLGGRVRCFRLAVVEDALVIHGTARSYYDKQLAQHALMHEAGVRVLANEIAVSMHRQPPAEQRAAEDCDPKHR